MPEEPKSAPESGEETVELSTEENGGDEKESIVQSETTLDADQPLLSLDEGEKEYSDEEFAKMLDLYDSTMQGIKAGEVVKGKILSVGENEVMVDIGFKSEGTISIDEFKDQESIEIGSEVEVYLEDVEDKEGQVVLSKQKADFMRVWDMIKEAHDSNDTIEGTLTRRIKGGIVVDLLGVDAFLPGSQIDIKQVRNFDQFVGQSFHLKIIKINKNRRNIVVSRRAVLEEEREKLRRTIIEDIQEGQIREGTVKNITDFGVFIDLGGVDGLLHITDMSWGRVNHPSELVAIGDEISVVILSFDEEKQRISLGLKQLQPHPWDTIEERYPVSKKVAGKVVSITDYGAFIELEEGVEGLVHISEMSWTQHIRHPSKVVSIGGEVEVVVLRVDKDEQKISLGIKQVQPDPWLTIEESYPSGTVIKGNVRNLTNFGAFVEIEEGIDGLVHVSDMSWTRRVRHPSEIMKKGDDVDVVILSVNQERRRISLGHKQVLENPWPQLADEYAPGTETEGTVYKLLDRGIVVELEGNVEGFIPTSQLGVPNIRKLTDHFEVGDKIPMKVIEFDEAQKKIVLSVKEYLRDKEQQEIEEYREKYQPKSVTIEEVIEEIPEASNAEDVEIETAAKDSVERIEEEVQNEAPEDEGMSEAAQAEVADEADVDAEASVEEVKKEVQNEAPEDEGTSEAAKAEVVDEAEVGAEASVEEVKKEVQNEAPEDEGTSEAAQAEVADEAEVDAEASVEEVKKEVQNEAPEDEGTSEAAQTEVAEEAEVDAEASVEEVKKEVQNEAPEDEKDVRSSTD